MSETGLRAGKEHKQLQWKHIEFDTDDNGNDITIVSVAEDTKTGQRDVIVGSYGTAIIKQLKEWSQFTTDEDFVFANPQNGEVIDRFDPRMTKFLEFAEIPVSKDGKKYLPYSLRHTYATRMRERGIADHIIARMMGHADTKMLERHYGQDDIRSHAGTINAADKKRRKKQNAVLIEAVASAPQPQFNPAFNLFDPNAPAIDLAAIGKKSKK